MTNAVVFTFDYDLTTGELISVTDGDGDETEITRDPATGDVISITSQDGQITTLTLDTNGYLATVANPNSETFQMVYDAGGLMKEFTRPKALTDPDPNASYTTSVTYDALGLLDRDTGANDGFLLTERTEDDDGYTVSATTAEGRVSTFRVEEDAAGNTLRINTDPSGLVTTTTELANSNVVATTPDGTTTTVIKIPSERFGMIAPLSGLKVQTPGGLTSNITPEQEVFFDASGDLSLQIDRLNINGRTFTSHFQTLDPTIFPSAFIFADTSPEGRIVRSFTDEQGRVVQQRIDGIFNTDFDYDPRGRLTGVTQGDGTALVDRTSSIVYYDPIDPLDPPNQYGFIKSITDPVGRVVRFEYDDVGRVKKQILPDLREINFTYDTNGNVESITPPGRPLHGFDYTNVDLENEYAPPNVSPPLAEPRTFFSYNLDKQLTEILRPDLKKINMDYDTGGRLKFVTLRENPADPNETQVYTYDYYADLPANAGQIGNLEKITAPDGGTLTFGYDGSLLLSSTWGGPVGSITGSVSRLYDADFRIISRSVNGANTIHFSYDADSLLDEVGENLLVPNAPRMNLRYDPIDPGTGLPFKNGLLRRTELWSDWTAQDSGVTDDYTYNSFGEVKGYQAEYHPVGTGAPETRFQTSFERDKLGRITQKTESVLNGPAKVTQYDYNPAGYLITVTDITDPVNPVQLSSYSYDLNGNRENNGAVYDDQDRLTSTSSATYTYTDNGELLTKTEGTDITQYKYDVLGNLLSVTLPSGTLIEYIIDGRNRRIGKKVDGILQQAWLYKDGLNPIAELDGAGNITARFVYASKVNVPDYVIVPTGTHAGTYRIISDHLGSPRLVVNIVDGSVKQSIEYDEWGNETGPRAISDFPNPFTFAGGIYDSNTKLVRFGARDYDPETGRWTSKDPIRFDGGGPNLYGYALNDPINVFDQNGLGPVLAGVCLELNNLKSISDIAIIQSRLTKQVEKINKRLREINKRMDDPKCSLEEFGRLLEERQELGHLLTKIILPATKEQFTGMVEGMGIAVACGSLEIAPGL